MSRIEASLRPRGDARDGRHQVARQTRTVRRRQMPKITTFLTYNDQAEQAVRHYLSVFEDGKILSTMPGPNGTVFSLTFELFGQTFFALNGGPSFKFAEGISLFVSCDTQAEIDHYW